MQAKAPISGILCTAVLAACGGSDGGSGGTGGSASLDTPQDAAAMIVMATALMEIGEGLDAKSGLPPLRKMTRSSAKARHQGKAVETVQCDSGSYTFNDASGRTDYDQCRFSGTYEGYSFSSLTDGVTIDACASGGWEGNTDCMGEYLYTMGENGQALREEYGDSDGEDFVFTALGSSRESEAYTATTESYDSTVNGRLTFQDRAAGQGRVELEFNNFRVRELYDWNIGQSQLSIDGRFGSNAGSALSDCNSGTATYQTTSPIVMDEQENLLSGDMIITNADGDRADVHVENNVITVTAGGTSRTYTQEELDALCS